MGSKSDKEFKEVLSLVDEGVEVARGQPSSKELAGFVSSVFKDGRDFPILTCQGQESSEGRNKDTGGRV